MTMFADLRYALRQLRRNPGFAALAAATLALAIAANSAVFSWIEATLLDPIPAVAHTGNMLTIQRGERSDHASPPFSYADYADLRASIPAFTGLIGYHDDYVSITGGQSPERVYAALVSANYFEAIGVHAAVGRTLAAPGGDERQAAPEAVLGYDLWRSRFNADPSVIGRAVEINLHQYTIVGVAQAGFQGVKSGLRTELFLPLAFDRRIWGSKRIDERGTSWLNVLGVLREGADAAEAEREVNQAMAAIALRFPETHQGDNRLSTDPLWRSPFGANVYLAGTLPILMALAAVLLLLAAANVANLLLMRAVGRRREFAIRLSIGITRGRLARQLLLENLLIAMGGGVLAVAATHWTADALGAFLEGSSLPVSIHGRLDWRVMAATFAVALLTAVVSGLAPAWRAASLSPATVLKDEAANTAGGLGRSRLASTLVIAQVALSLLLLASAGLFVHSLRNERASSPGFDPARVALVSFDLDPLGYNDERGVEFERALLDRVRALPGVESATLADFSPLSFTIHSDGVEPEGYIARPHESMEADRGIVAPGYLATLKTPLVAGREFVDADTAGSLPVVMVNQAFVDRYWPGQNALGKHALINGRNRTVVGVAANARLRRLSAASAPLVLVPLAQRYQGLVTLHARVKGDPMAMQVAIERAAHELNAGLPLFNVNTLEGNLRIGNVFERIVASFAGAFGALALLLAAVGLYAVVSCTTRQRTQEIGIRMALGAARMDVFANVLGQGMRLTMIGLAVGLLAAALAARMLEGMLYGIGGVDWMSLAVVTAGLALVAAVASFLPARRAANVEPARALRDQ